VFLEVFIYGKIIFLEVFICGKILCFQHSNHSYFLLSLAGSIVLTLRFLIAYCETECKRKKSEVFSYFKKSKVNILLEVIISF